MPFTALIGAGLGLVGSIIQGNAAGDAADAQAAAAKSGALVQWKMFQQMRHGLAPYRKVGVRGLSSLANLYGLGKGGGGAFSDKAIAAFQRSPDYQVAKRLGISAIDQSAAARGDLLGGAQIKRVQQFGSDLASTHFNNYVDRLAGFASLGENAAAQTGNAGITTGQNIANSYLRQGEAQASGIMGQGSAWAQGLSSLGNNLAQIQWPGSAPANTIY